MKAGDPSHRKTSLGFLLLLLHSLASVVYVSNALRTYHVYLNRSIPVIAVEQEFLGVETRCSCRTRCEIFLGCTAVTAVETDSGAFDCLLTTSNLTGVPLAPSDGVTLVDKDGYIPTDMMITGNTLAPENSRFFLSAREIFGGSPSEQQSACQAEGGTPAILNTAASMDEVFSAYGAELFLGGAWVPLLHRAFAPPVWSDGSTNIPYAIVALGSGCFHVGGAKNFFAMNCLTLFPYPVVCTNSSWTGV